MIWKLWNGYEIAMKCSGNEKNRYEIELKWGRVKLKYFLYEELGQKIEMKMWWNKNECRWTSDEFFKNRNEIRIKQCWIVDKIEMK